MSNPADSLATLLAALNDKQPDVPSTLAVLTRTAVQLAEATNNAIPTVQGWLVLQAAADAMMIAMCDELTAEEHAACLQMTEAVFSALEQMKGSKRAVAVRAPSAKPGMLN